MSRTTAFLLFSLICALLFGWWMCAQVKKERGKRLQAESNVESLARLPDTIVQELTVSKADFARLFPAQADSLKALGYKLSRVKSYHSIVYRYLVDTVVQAVHDTIGPDINTWNWSYSQNCLNSEFSFSDTSGQADMKIYGEVPISITTVLDRPAGWFWKLKWNPNKWPVQTVVENPCGLDIKQNSKFILK